jgi:hypothetical protein
MTRSAFLVAAGACALVGISAHAQAPRYLPQRDTVVMTSRNPFRMYYVRGADTLGNPVFARGISREVWRAKGDSVDIEVMHRDLAFLEKDTTRRALVAPDGRELPENGHAPYGLPTSLMPLPATPLRAGLEWHDSSVVARDTNGFGVRFESVMAYKVRRIVDTLGSRVADVVADGQYRMRDQFGDSVRKRQWIDVRGPDHETFLFDINRGRLVYRSWDMKLRGWGGGRLPGDSVATADSVPAGLDSKTFDRLVPLDEQGIVGYRQQGRDTSVTVTVPDAGIAGLHIIDRGGDSVVSSHIRADGDLTLERARYARGALVQYERAWTDTTLRGIRERVTRRGDSIVVTRSDGERRAYRARTARVAVGDVGHEELLVPLIMQLPVDTAEMSVAVFRPTFRRFDDADVSRRPVRGGGWLVRLKWDGTELPDMWIVDENGDLLFVESQSDEHTRRVPTQQARIKAMTALGESLRAGAGSK